MLLLSNFAKLHQHDERKTYRAAWENFNHTNEDILLRECMRLKELGYTGDCYDKMYKSARYYFRQKIVSKKEPKQRRKYFACDRDIIDAMDQHITIGIDDTNFKPSSGYDAFISSHIELIKKEITRMINHDFTDSEYIIAKIKKTYKNRYFQIIHSK